jgi:hypothetical protein
MESSDPTPSGKPSAEEAPAALKFKVAPHIVEDLGLNLYTSLPRVLVEFVANAHDADAKQVRITLDKPAIDKHRRAVKAQYDKDKALAAPESDPTPLGMRALPSNIQIVIEDDGIGMSRKDLQEKYLVAGRRRRQEGDARTPNGRVAMGRKGLGKLAGFGVAKTVTITTKSAQDSVFTTITLSYDDLIRSKTTEGIVVPETMSETCLGIAGPQGTRVVLSDLLYDPTKSRDSTIEGEIAEHFALIDQQDFMTLMNGVSVQPAPRILDWAWPEPDKAVEEFVGMTLPADEEAPEVSFRYRIRFTAPKHALLASHRGVRIYANRRLASAPSLLDADTNMHGFRMTDYLDGVVHADFIDEQPLDYIATDRQGLRWESPFLAPLRKFLSEEIKNACKAYQKKRDDENEAKVDDDTFTSEVIAAAPLSKSERSIAKKVARSLARAYGGTDKASYKETLRPIVDALGHGSILTAINKLAEDDRPELRAVVVELTRLTRDEMESFVKRARARLDGIRVMKKVVRQVDFKAKENERQLQTLFEKSPWLLDATYTQFISADERMASTMDRLANELKIGKHAPPVKSDDRPDLVFLLGGTKAGRVVVVELKSANLELEIEHLNQLEAYIGDAEEWLAEHGFPHIKVEGQLIGSMAPVTSRKSGVRSLRQRMKKTGPTEAWKIRDYVQVLEETELAHQELLDIQGEDGDDD